MIKKTLLLLSASLPLTASVEDACCNTLLPPEPIESCQVPAGIFYPGQYTLGNSCVNLTVSGEFLYWEVNPDSLEQIATKFAGTFAGGPGTLTTLTSISHYQNYRPGFKIGAGIGFPCLDNWEADVEYTWFYHTTTKNYNATGNGEFFVSKFIPNIYFVASTQLRSDRKFNLNFLHGLLGKTFYLSQRLLTKASCGLKSWWTTEKQDLRFTTLNNQIGTQVTKVGLWGIGPYVKADIKLLLWCGTYVRGKAGIWTTYTRQNKYRCTTNFPAVAAVGFPGFIDDETQTGKLWLVRLFYEGGVALGWGTYFCDCGYHVDLSVGYDMMSNYVGPYAVTVGNHLKAFYYQGFSARAQLDF
ncbi:MAG: hypothetical protein JSS30_02690 [Verrucomicrobia bacterium]|nr:hypothetical protein [Verrucomicrobiota bacterium]